MAESKRLENAGMNSAIELSSPYFHCLGLHRASFVFEIEILDRLSKTRVSIAASNPCDSVDRTGNKANCHSKTKIDDFDGHPHKIFGPTLNINYPTV